MKERKQYSQPIIDVIYLDIDVITTSVTVEEDDEEEGINTQIDHLPLA